MDKRLTSPHRALHLMNCLECQQPTYVQDGFPRICASCMLKIKSERDQLLEQNKLLERRQSNRYVEKLELDVAQLVDSSEKLIKRLHDRGDAIPAFSVQEVERAITVARTTCGFPNSHQHGCLCLVNQPSENH
jgi:hypothetical protein